ncbi:hypothetical protein Agabi119p4_7864 [Agaricus bisporus var. burnettii]|uniref:BTB domain-containing protein n=1 Tax=Agaricus bisporus var. burnettii TaxID=192524 RepID=A0A8H7EZG2_AGABI|nr:hypothetical protein Agabi119p4_7864 [Agaricus bisporus var. burnettii]
MAGKSESGKSIKRDRDYYYSDGSCLILIENRLLFKIHRSRLEDDSVVFRDMFSLPQPDTGNPQEFDEPIILHDSVRDFRALCWALYARPSEIAAQMPPTDKINMLRIVSIITMAQKYDFEDLRDWAFGVLDAHLREPRILCPDWTVMGRLLEFANANNKKELVIRIEQQWLRNIMTLPHQGNCFVKALDTAEHLNLRQFHGKIYHCYLKALGKFNSSPAKEDSDAPVHIGNAASLIERELICDQLDDTRRLRLYHGFLSLMQLRNNLDKSLPLSDNDHCQKHINCQRGWDIWWSEFLVGMQKAQRGERSCDPDDFFHKLEQRIMARPILVPYGTREVYCQALIKAQVCATKKQFDDTLADHFMIPAE